MINLHQKFRANVYFHTARNFVPLKDDATVRTLKALVSLFIRKYRIKALL